MSLASGLYNIRFVPIAAQPTGSSGLFATSTDIGAPLVTEGDATPQAWNVQLGDDGKYTIHQAPFIPPGEGPGPVAAGWGIATTNQSFPAGDVLFQVDVTEFQIELVEGQVFSIQVPNPGGQHAPTLDSEFFITVQDNTLVSQAFLSSLSTQQPRPHWEFLPVSN